MTGDGNSILAGAGANTISYNGNGGAITGGSGPTTITASGSRVQIAAGSGSTTINATGAGATITAPTGSTVSANVVGDGAFIVSNASGVYNLTGAGDVVQINSGAVTVGVNNVAGARNTLYAGGALTVAVQAGSETLLGPNVVNYTPGAHKLAVLVNSSRYDKLSNLGLSPQSFVDSSQFEISAKGATKPATRFVYNPSTGDLIFTPYGAVPISSEIANLGKNLQLSASDLFISNMADTGASTQSVTAGASVPAYTPPPVAAAPAANFYVTDTTTAVSTTTAGQAYTGPVTYLTQEYYKTSLDALDTNTSGGMRIPDAIAIAANVPNVFIAASGGEAVSVKSGQNVLSGGPGSNYLIGTTLGNGVDSFFTDARTGGVLVWNTIINFHAADTVGLWGFVQGVSTFAWKDDNEGAEGAKGITLDASLSGAADPTAAPDAKVTLAGLHTADLANIAVTYGNIGGNNPYLELTYLAH